MGTRTERSLGSRTEKERSEQATAKWTKMTEVIIFQSTQKAPFILRYLYEKASP